MDALGSPMEALDINYVRFGFFAVVNNLWAWAAAVTAALSFWRFRAAAGSGAPAASLCYGPQPPRDDACSTGSSAVSCTENQRPSPAQSAGLSSSHASPEPALRPLVALVPSGYDVTRGRFMAYFQDDSWSTNGDENDIPDDGAPAGEAEVGGESLVWSGAWEKVLGVRNGDVGWYRHQDVAVLDGSVVRLWDDDRRLIGRLLLY